MSADNGIYILESPSNNGMEYRVTEAQAIENINYEPDYGEFNKGYLIDYFDGCVIHKSIEDAMKMAYSILQKLCVCEYGISVIKSSVPFPEG